MEAGTSGKLNHRPAFFRLMLGGKAQLPQGEGIRIIGLDDDQRPLHVTFQPLRYTEMQAQIVSEDIRHVPGYAGYELSVKTARTIADFQKEACQT